MHIREGHTKKADHAEKQKIQDSENENTSLEETFEPIYPHKKSKKIKDNIGLLQLFLNTGPLEYLKIGLLLGSIYFGGDAVIYAATEKWNVSSHVQSMGSAWSSNEDQIASIIEKTIDRID